MYVLFFTASSSVNGESQADDGALLLMKLNSAVNTCRMHGEEESAQARFAVLTCVAKTSRGTSSGRGAATHVPPFPLADKLLEFATAEAVSWGMDLRPAQTDGGGMELVLKSSTLASGVLAGNVWGEPVVGASAAALADSASTLFPLNCLANVRGFDKETCDQLCIQVPAGSPLYYARANQSRVVRVTPNAKLNVSKLGVVSLVALDSPIAAGTPLSVAPPIVAVSESRGTAPVELVDGGVEATFQPDRFIVHLQMFKVSRVLNPAFFCYIYYSLFNLRSLSSLLACQLRMWEPLLPVSTV